MIASSECHKGVDRRAHRFGWSALALAAVLGGLVARFVSPQATLVSARVESDSNAALANPFNAVAKLVAPAVVFIESKHPNNDGKTQTEESGSGVLVRPEGLNRAVIVTNHHVVADRALDAIDIILADSRSFHPTRVYSDKETDLAVLEADIPDLPAAKIGDSDTVEIGQWVLAIGSPFGLMQTVTHGIISATHRRQVGAPHTMRIREFLQTDAAINPGSSGGPLVNLRGEVIGINTAIASNSGYNTGVGFSIPINIVRLVVNDLLKKGKVSRAYLGIGFPKTFDPDKARQLGLSSVRGALVEAVKPDSPADRAGLKPGDVVLEVDGRAIEDENHLINIISLSPVGSRIELIIWREKAKQQLTATLAAWTEPNG